MAPNFVLGAKFTYRKLGRVIEDFLVPSSRATTSSPTRSRARSARSSPSTTGVRHGAGAEGRAEELQLRAQRPQALLEQLAVPGELRLDQARGQLRRPVPELDRPARPEHQLGLRLRRLPGQRPGPAVGRAPAPVQVRRQLRVQGRARRPQRRAQHLVLLGPAAERLRLLVRRTPTGSTTWRRAARSAADRPTTRPTCT